VSVVLQISDPHFGTEQPPVVAALLRLAREQQPDIALFSGDITQRARRRQFQAARAFAEQLPVQSILAIPGNHDIPLYNLAARLFWPYAGFRKAFGANLEPECELADLLILCVNTTRPRRHKDGEVSADQVDRVAARLQQARREQLRVVVTHQPVHVIRPNDECNLLHGHEAAVQRWTQAGADIIVGGHIHLPYVRPLSDRLKNLPRRIWSVQAGTAVSHRVRGNIPNSVNLIRCDGSLVGVIERWDYSGTLAVFERVETFTLPLERPAEPRLTSAAHPIRTPAEFATHR
jgi:3',5'-cyclic AMP phosphodiesterase CpdA